MTFLFFATSNFKPDTGGIAELGHQLVLALHKAGNDVTVIAGGSETDSFDRTVPYRIERIMAHQPFKLANMLIEEKRPDALFVMVIGSSWYTAYRLGKKYGIPVLLYVHGLEITKRNNIFSVFLAKQFVKGLILRRSNLVICNSFNTMLLAIKRGAIPDHVRVLHPGIIIDSDIENYKSRIDPAPGKTVFFTMGRLIRRKGVDNAIHALSRLVGKYPTILYVIAGAGSDLYRRELEKLAASLGVEDHVRFLGRIEEDDKQFWYNRQDVFIMPSRELSDGDVEGFGIVFLEAGAWGKPVIGGDFGGVPDAIENGKSGLLVNSKSVEAIAEGMRFFLDHPEKMREMGDYGRKRALDWFSWDLQAERFVRIVENYISRSIQREFDEWKGLPINEFINKEIARENLLILKETFDEAGLPFIIFFGTLLGAIREHDFIAHDTDTDVILFESYRDLLYKTLPVLEEKGLKLVRSVKNNLVLSLYRKGEYLDLYFIEYRRIGFREKWYIYYSSISKKLLLNYSWYEFLGEKFRIPRNSHKVLTQLYKKDWNITKIDYEANQDYLMKFVRFLQRRDKIKSIRKFIRWIKER